MQQLAALDLDDGEDQPWPPRLGLLSLWDIMERVSPGKYIKLGTNLKRHRSSVHRRAKAAHELDVLPAERVP